MRKKSLFQVRFLKITFFLSIFGGSMQASNRDEGNNASKEYSKIPKKNKPKIEELTNRINTLENNLNQPSNIQNNTQHNTKNVYNNNIIYVKKKASKKRSLWDKLMVLRLVLEIFLVILKIINFFVGDKRAGKKSNRVPHHRRRIYVRRGNGFDSQRRRPPFSHNHMQRGGGIEAIT